MAAENIRIVVKTVNNDLYNLAVEGSTTVIDLKERIREATSVEVNRQRLIYRGRVLLDESLVRDYNIEDGHTVHMVARPVNFQELQQSAGATSQSSTDPAPAVVPSAGGVPQTRVIASTGATLALGPAEESNTMEHVRQNILTIHTLLSTLASSDLTRTTASPSPSYNSDSSLQAHEESSGLIPMGNGEFSLRRNIPPAPVTTTRRFFVGQWVDVKDTVNQWLEATIMNISEAEQKMFVHYNGWPDRWDEWLSFDSPRVAPFRSRTVHSTLTPYLSPTPNVSLARAPITGANDLRTLLPEVARMFRVMQPIIENAAELAEQSLQDRPTVSAYTTPAPASAATSAPVAVGQPDTASLDAAAGLRRRAGATSVRPASTTVIIDNPPARIAPGMPWENVGTQRPVADDSSPTRGGERRVSGALSTERHTSGTSSATSSSDRRQRLRYADYDASQERSPVESPVPFASLASDSLTFSPDQRARDRDRSLFDTRVVSSEDATTSHNSRKRSAEFAENEVDDLCHHRQRETRQAEEEEEEENSKMSGDGGDNEEEGKEDDEEAMESVTPPSEEEIAQQRAARVAVTDAQLRHLAQELCPLIDRFGRVLTDIAPHLWEIGGIDAIPPAPAASGVPVGVAGANGTDAENAFEASLLSLLRERPPSPQARRAYRTPIALQTRIGGAGAVGGVGGFGIGGHGVVANNALSSLLGDLAFLGGTAEGVAAGGPGASRTVMLPGGGVAGAGGANGARQVDIHIAFMPQTAQPVAAPRTAVTQTQDRAARDALSSSILQAQMAQNLAARTQLLTHRTQELNNYSLAIEEMLRSLTSGEGAAGTTAGTTSDAANAAVPAPASRSSPQQTRTVRTTSEDGIMRGPMPSGPSSAAPRSRSSSATGTTSASTTTVAGPSARTAPVPVPVAVPPGYGRVYASSILPGSLRTIGRPTTFLVSPAGLQPVSMAPPPPPLPAPTTSSRANWTPPTAADSASPASIPATTSGQEAMDEGYSVSMELEQREGEPSDGAGTQITHTTHLAATEEGDEEEEDEEEETAPPLDDLLPTLSFNELGQSLMDVRGARANLAQETLRESENPDGAPVSPARRASSGRSTSSNGSGPELDTVAANTTASADGAATTAAPSASVAQQQAPQPQQANSVFDRIRRSFAFS